MYQYLILFLLKDTCSRISTPLKESPNLPTNYLPTKRIFGEFYFLAKKGFMGHYLLTKRVSIRGGAGLVPCFAKPHLAASHDKKATLFNYKPQSK